jgi:hypothetical protein
MPDLDFGVDLPGQLTTLRPIGLAGAIKDVLPTIGLPQLVFMLVTILIVWAIYRPGGPRSR